MARKEKRKKREETVLSKKRTTVYLDESLLNAFWEYIRKKYRSRARGMLSYEIEQAMRDYLTHTQS